jgi:hypothetical protein
VPGRRRQPQRGERNRAADHVADGLSAALVRDVRNLQVAGQVLEQLRGQVLRRAVARAGVGELAGIGLGVGDQLPGLALA